MNNKGIVYPVVLSKGKSGKVLVYIPDFDSHTEGADMADALYMAQDSIGLSGICIQDDKEAIPTPSDINALKVKDGEIKTLVAVDFDAYRRKFDKKVIKKTLSIPSWLNVQAEEAGVNFSAVLQDALKAKLGVEL